MSNTNTNLHRAKRIKDDEFYTTYETVKSELIHYAAALQGKTVLCNCDHPIYSNFSRFFIHNFNAYGLKRLICTSYCSNASVAPTMFEITPQSVETINDDCHGLLLDVNSVDDSRPEEIYTHIKQLKGNGDFRSSECLAYLKECDIVITNPPFSLFKEFVAEIMRHNKKFLIIGNQNALTYKEIFPLLQNNTVWTGFQFGEMKFRVPANTKPRNTRYWVDEQGQKWRSLGNAMWLTNLDNERRHRTLTLKSSYDPEKHRKYDNFDAIHIRNIGEIPADYSGIMGVPITIINIYNSEQFEIVGEANHGSDSKYDIFKPLIDGKEVFKRILIRNKALV